MGLGDALVAFIVVGLPMIAIYGLVSRLYRHRERKLELEAQIAAAGSAEPEYRSKIEERLRVLERIVTDQGHGVAHEIEQLRSERLSSRPAKISEQAGN
jgi:hypothetical protein